MTIPKTVLRIVTLLGSFVIFIFLNSLQASERKTRNQSSHYSAPSVETEEGGQSNLSLIRHLRENVIVAPSGQKYNLSHPEREDASQFKQGLFLKEYFKNKRNGTFIEAGAWDGETYSNTLILERQLGWTGLLVEPNPIFKQILEKHRNAHSAHCCLSLTPKPTELKISLMNTGSFVIDPFDPLDKFLSVENVDCYPLFSLMAAMNITTLDLLSLDLEGVEVKVLETIPWEKVDIKTIIVEANHVLEGKTYLKKYMEIKNYRLQKELHIDYFFVKNQNKL